ncbi:MAG: hypothetical protein HYX73_01065 [Acidobacteria bacterium]|nr:hypothetical protein [Acidobacteriota bacterium]
MNWLSLSIQATLVLLTGYVTFWFTRRHYRYQQRHSFVERQLEELYSPLLALWNEIKRKRDIRSRVSTANDEEWRRLCDQTSKMHDPIEAFYRLEKKHGPVFQASIDYDNEQLKSTILPSYRQMLSIFQEKLWLAEPDTTQYLPALTEFVDLWDRWLAESIPAAVVKNLGHSEKQLHAFYEHLERKYEELRTIVAGGKV